MRIKNLLVTGRPGSGKTTLLDSLVGDRSRDAGGFLTREIRERGVRKGFGILALDGKTGTLAHVDIRGPLRVGKYGVDVQGLEQVAVPALRHAVAQSRLIIIDEIGRMELASEEFRRAVLEALDSGRVVLATIQQHAHPFTDSIKRRPDAKLFEITPENRGALRQTIAAMLDELLRESS